MKIKIFYFAFITLIVFIGVIFSCKKDVLVTQTDEGLMLKSIVLADNYEYFDGACETECIDPEGSYYVQSNSVTRTWGNVNNPQSKTVNVNAYNTPTQFIIEIISDKQTDALNYYLNGVLQDEVTFETALPANTAYEIKVDLGDYNACDTITYEIEQVDGGGNNLKNEFDDLGTLTYRLVEECINCPEENFTITDKGSGWYDFVYSVGSEAKLGAHLVLTFAQAENITIIPDGDEEWYQPGNGHNRQVNMNLEACHTYTWQIQLTDCTAENPIAEAWTDFTITTTVDGVEITESIKDKFGLENIEYECPQE